MSHLYLRHLSSQRRLTVASDVIGKMDAKRSSSSFTLIFALVFVFVQLKTRPTESLSNGVALTPPMGWLSWIRFGCNTRCDIDPENCISQWLYMKMADIMVNEGYLAAGYKYVAIDDCWMAKTRDANGNLQPDPERFPNGIKALADYVHRRNLKLGIYLCVGEKTCAGYPGSKYYLWNDALTIARWEVDMVKMDGCYSSASDYEYAYPAFQQYLYYTGRPIVYSCQWPMYARYYGATVNYAFVSRTCNVFRALTDVYDSYYSVKTMLDYFAFDNYNMSSFAGPGAWNDPDQLTVGNYGLSEDQERLNMVMWCMLAAPLLMSNDLRSMRRSSKVILLNRNIIAINQDPLGKQAKKVFQIGSVEVWTKTLYGAEGSVAIAFLNANNTGAAQRLLFSLNAIVSNAQTSYSVMELIDGQHLGLYKPTDLISICVNPTGVYLVRVTPVA